MAADLRYSLTFIACLPNRRVSKLVYHAAAGGATIVLAVLRFWILILVASAAPAQALYELSGRISPEGLASVTLFGATKPFSTSTLTDGSGRFTFKKLEAAAYM